MSNVIRLPPCHNSHVDEEIPTSQGDELELAIGPALNAHPTTGNAKRRVCFLARVYYDRLALKGGCEHLANSDRQLHHWREKYGIHAARVPV